MALIILKNSRTTVIKTIGVSMFIYSLITGVIIEYKMEILGGSAFSDNVIMGTFYKGLYKKWFCVSSFKRNIRYNVIYCQGNNENPLYYKDTVIHFKNCHYTT